MQSPRKERIVGALAIALVLSLLVHLVIGLIFLHFRGRNEKNQEVVQRVAVITLIRLHPTPTPAPLPTPTPEPTPTPVVTPTPKITPPPQTPPPQTPKPHQPTPAPAHAAPPHLHLNVPHTQVNKPNAPTEAHADHEAGTQEGTTTGHGVNGTGEGTGNAPHAVPAPAAPPAPPAACAHPEADATVLVKAEAEAPDEAQGASGYAEVRVDLSATSQVLNLAIQQSTGSPALDNAALDAARHSTFQTAMHDCHYIARSYLFRVNFDSQ